MAPTGGETSHRNGQLTCQLTAWANRDQTGLSFDSSGGFKLPNGSIRFPDAAWVRRDRCVHLYQPGQDEFCLTHPRILDGAPVLVGFELDFSLIWSICVSVPSGAGHFGLGWNLGIAVGHCNVYRAPPIYRGALSDFCIGVLAAGK